jgi:hypothetical protein
VAAMKINKSNNLIKIQFDSIILRANTKTSAVNYRIGTIKKNKNRGKQYRKVGNINVSNILLHSTCSASISL